MERRVLRSVMCAFYSREEILQTTVNSTSPPVTVSTHSFQNGIADFALLEKGQQLEVRKRCVRQYSPSVISDAVAFILSSHNVSFISWGTKYLRVDMRKEIFPRLLCKHSRKHIYDSYLLFAVSSNHVGEGIAKTSFQSIVNCLTAEDPQLQSSVDYVTGYLVNGPADTICDVLNTYHMASDIRKEFLADLEWSSLYLKYGFERVVKDGSHCLLHNIQHGLNIHCPELVDCQICIECKSLFSFYSRLHDTLVAIPAHASAIDIVDECSSKARLFTSHKLRVINQQTTIQGIKDTMKSLCTINKSSDKAIVLLDYKMKLEPIYYREKTSDHYGKRGISWHGAMIYYFSYERNIETGTWHTVENTLYFDSLADVDSKQDKHAVLAMIEVVMLRIQRTLPHIKTIVLQSDNAACYSNTLLPLALPFLSKTYGLVTERFIHTKTQDGKSILDAHFATSGRILHAWVKEGNNCVTPTQAVTGLKLHGGLPNCIVDLVECDQPWLHQFTQKYAELEKALAKIMTRANDIVYIKNLPITDDLLANINHQDDEAFFMRVFAHSDIGEGVLV